MGNNNKLKSLTWTMMYIYRPDVANLLPICDLHPRYFKPLSGPYLTHHVVSCGTGFTALLFRNIVHLDFVEVCQVHDKELILLFILRLFGDIVHCISPHYKNPTGNISLWTQCQ